jgi:hypothetical protein
MSAGSFVARQRDHRRDRGKPGSNDVVNDVSKPEQDARKMCIETSPVVFPFLVSEKNEWTSFSVTTGALYPCALFESKIEIDPTFLETLIVDRRRFRHDVCFQTSHALFRGCLVDCDVLLPSSARLMYIVASLVHEIFINCYILYRSNRATNLVVRALFIAFIFIFSYHIYWTSK